jgi:hypothetical protein
MPTLDSVLTESDLKAPKPKSVMDLTAYIEIMESIQEKGGLGGTVTLGEGESQRTEKRRLSLAAKEKKLTLTWRKAPDGKLKFVLSPEGERAPGGRRRREVAETPVEAPEAAPAEATEATPSRRGRRR